MQTNVEAPNEGIARKRRRQKLATKLDRDRLDKYDYRREDVLRDAFAEDLTIPEVAWAFSKVPSTISRWLDYHNLSAADGRERDASTDEHAATVNRGP